jgi:hypothetical protein
LSSNPEPTRPSHKPSYDFSIPALSPKAAAPPLRPNILTVASILGIVFFLLSGFFLLPLTGFQSNEVRFIYDLWRPQEALSTIALGKHLLPSMLIPHLGALRSWVYGPILSNFGWSVYAVRLPMLLLAALTIVMTGKLTRRIQGRTAATVAVVLLSTDVIFLSSSVFDWGPVVLGSFLLVSGLLCALKWYHGGRNRFAFLTGLAYGLALWNNTRFLWNLFGMLVALCILALPLVVRRWTWKPAALLVLGLCLGSYPLLKYHVQADGSRIRTHSTDATDGRSAPSADVDWPVPNVDRQPHSLGRSANSSARLVAGLLLLGFGLVIATSTQRKWILFFLISGCFGWLPSATAPDAGPAAQQSVIFWYTALALSAGCLAHWRKPANVAPKVVAAVIAMLVVAGAFTVSIEYENLLRHGPTIPWTNADAALASKLSELGAKRAVTADWGIANVIAVRSSDRIAVDEQVFNLNGGKFDREHFETCKAPECWIVSHVPQSPLLPKASQLLRNSLDADGFQRSNESTVIDTHGTPTFLVFAVHSPQRKAQPDTGPPPPPIVSSTPALFATPTVILSSSGIGRTILTWQVPADMYIEVHVDKPDGAVFAASKGPGTGQTGPWVRNGMQFFLQDVSNRKPRTAENTLAHVRVEVRSQ